MFFFGAIWNLLGGTIILGFAQWIFGAAGLTPPHPPLYYQAWVALFMTFGIGYVMISRDLYGNKNIVWLGMIGKLAFAAVFLYNFYRFAGEVPQLFLIPVIGDLVFVILFALFLRFAQRNAR